MSKPTQTKPIKTTNGTPQTQLPNWMQQLRQMYESAQAHAFVLHFNVRDYAEGTTPLTDYIFQRFARKKCLVRYNIAEGITFPMPSMRSEFDRYTQDANQPADPNASALASLGLAAPSTPGQTPLPKATARALPLLETLLRNAVDVAADGTLSGQAAVVIEFAETVCPNAEIAMMSPDDRTTLVTLERLGADPKIAETGNLIILVTENVNDLHPALRKSASKFEQIEVPLPNFDERRGYIGAQTKARGLQLADGLTVESFAAQTAMLNRMHIEDICLRACDAGGVVTRDLIRERKQQIIAAEFGEVIEIVEPRFGFEDIGGHDQVKEFFRDYVIEPIQSGERDLVPMGVLLTGPAGTGKTIMAEAVAFESKINEVALNPAKLFGQFVGNTERNLDRALRAVVAMAPTLVFIDEIDQAVNRGQGGDSGVSNRFFKRLLEFMSDTTHRGQVVFLAATNRPDMIDAALRRPGRFDLKIPFLIPDDADRENILKVMARRYGLGTITPTPETIRATDKWTGAEIEAAAVKARRLLRKDSLDPAQALEQAVKRLRPSTADIEFQTLIALKECNDTDLLPPKYREQLENRSALEQQIEASAKGRAARSM